jgi:hypothetical protein
MFWGCASTPAPITVASNALPNAPVATQKTLGPPLASATYSVNIYNHPSVDPENSLPTAGGIVRIRAPLQTAYEAAIDFNKIYELNPYIEKSVVVAIEGDATDVYLRVPTVINQDIWAVVRFRTTKLPNGGWSCKGEMVRGNLDDLRISWRLEPSGNETLGQFELLADPALPLPRSWVTRDTRDGVHIMLERFRYKVEARSYRPRFEDDLSE